MAATAIGTFLLRQALMTVPRDYWDAAQVDGCGRLRFLWSVALPIVSPAVTTVAVFAAFQFWNALLWPLVITGSEALRPVQVAILYFQGEIETRFNLLMAAATITVLPGIIFYFLAQRQFVEGLSASGIKG
jgi:multiple sugar transport system permease protein